MPEEFDGRVGAKLRGERLAAPAGLWADIAAALPPRRRRRGGAWWWLGAGGVLALAVGLLWWGSGTEDAAAGSPAIAVAALPTAAPAPEQASALRPPEVRAVGAGTAGVGTAEGTSVGPQTAPIPDERPAPEPPTADRDDETSPQTHVASPSAQIASPPPPPVAALADGPTRALPVPALRPLPTAAPPVATWDPLRHLRCGGGARAWRQTVTLSGGLRGGGLRERRTPEASASLAADRERVTNGRHLDNFANAPSQLADLRRGPAPALPVLALDYALTHRSGLRLRGGLSVPTERLITIGLAGATTAFADADYEVSSVTYRRFAAEASLGYARAFGRWTLGADVGAVGLAPKRVDAGGTRVRLGSRVLAKAELGIAYGLTERLGLELRGSGLGARGSGAGVRGLVGVAYRW